MPHSYVWHDLFICVTWLIHMCDTTHSLWSELSQQSARLCMSMCVTRLIHACDIRYLFGWHASCVCVTWLLHSCDMIHSYLWYDSSIMTGADLAICMHVYSDMCDMNNSYVCHNVSIHVTCLIGDMTNSSVWHDSFTCMIWLIFHYDRSHRSNLLTCLCKCIRTWKLT